MMYKLKDLFLIFFWSSAILFLGDALWLYFAMSKFFAPRIKHLMMYKNGAFSLIYSSAFLAYVLMSIALVCFVVLDSKQSSYASIFFRGALLGLCIYGIYDFTNHATLHGWDLTFLTADILWGTLWFGVSSVLSVMMLRFLKVF